MNVLIYGYGLYEGGFSIANYFVKKGDNVRITDLREEKDLGENIQKLKTQNVEIIAGAHRVEDFKWADLVIKTPSIAIDNPFLSYAKNVTGEFSYLFENENVAKTKLIFVTGTKNKTFTSEALCSSLKSMGKKARICGSIDSTVFNELERWEKGDVPEFLICKMSSWQLRDAYHYCEGYLPATELMVVTSPVLNEYYEKLGANTKTFMCPDSAKYEIKEKLKVSLRRISLVENNISGIASDIPSNLIITYSILKKLGFKPSAINKALKGFKGIPHRMEIVKSTESLLVVNDSVATIPEAVNLCLQNFKSNPVNLICGGDGINLNAESMLDVFKSVSSVYLLDGSYTQNQIIPLLKENSIKFYGPYKLVEEAVEEFKKNFNETKKVLQVLLFSPGAPSNEFYLNEFDRGNHFRDCFK